jgi:hypothetical protein
MGFASAGLITPKAGALQQEANALAVILNALRASRRRYRALRSRTWVLLRPALLRYSQMRARRPAPRHTPAGEIRSRPCGVFHGRPAPSTRSPTEMLSPPATDAAVLPGYDLREPGEADTLAALRRVFGHERGTERWAQACAAAELKPNYVNNTQKLDRVVAALAAQGGAAASVAQSVVIRQRTFTRLSAIAARQAR